jgi:hypothetical protein
MNNDGLSVSIGDILAKHGVAVTTVNGGQKIAADGGAGRKLTKPAKPKFTFGRPPAVPMVAKVAITDTEKAAAKAEIDAFTKGVDEAMKLAVNQLWQIREAGEARVAYADAEQQIEASIAEMLSYNDPWRMPARLAFAEAIVGGCPERRDAITFVLDRLVADGFLKEVGRDDAGKYIYGKFYKLANDVRRESRAQASASALEKLVSQAVEAGRTAFEAEEAELVEKAGGANQLTPEEVGAGKAGRAVLYVPDKHVGDRFFKGGVLLVEVADEKVRILEGIGGMRRFASEIAAAGLFLPCGQLVNEKLNFGGKTLPIEVFNRLVGIHDNVRRGMAETAKRLAGEARKTEWRSQTDGERAELASEADLTSDEFFAEGKTGTVFVDFGRKPFESKKRGEDSEFRIEKIWDVIALVERREDGQIRVARCPDRLKTFFGGAQDWANPEENFLGLLWPLAPIMRIEAAKVRTSRK